MPSRADGPSVKLTALLLLLLLLLLLASLRGGGTEAKNAAKLGSILKFTLRTSDTIKSVACCRYIMHLFCW